MVQDRIFIEYDEGTGWVGIRKESRSGLSELDGFQLPPEFSPQDVRESLLATGSVTESTEGLVIVHQTSCQTLRQTGLVVDVCLARSDGPRGSGR
jgi:hypothetical protein